MDLASQPVITASTNTITQDRQLRTVDQKRKIVEETLVVGASVTRICQARTASTPTRCSCGAGGIMPADLAASRTRPRCCR